jgi:hypothetical protein
MWVTVVTFTASIEKVLSPNSRIGFLSAAKVLSTKLARGGLSEKQVMDMTRTVTNLRVDALVASFFLVLVGAIVLVSVFRWVRIVYGIDSSITSETEPVYLSPEELIETNHHGLCHSVQGAALVVLGVMPNSLKPSVHSHDACSQTAVTLSAENAHGHEGARWAARETARFSRPRCC